MQSRIGNKRVPQRTLRELALVSGLIVALAAACTGLKNGDELPSHPQGGDDGVAGSAVEAGKGGTPNTHPGLDGGNAGDTQSTGGVGASTPGGSGGAAGSSGAGGSTPLGGMGGEGGDAGAGGEGGHTTTRGRVGACNSYEATSGKTIYACDCLPGAADCVAGDDTNGTGSLMQPFRTYERLRQAFNNNLKAGDAVAFCRGGTFSVKAGDNRGWYNPACNDADKPCTIRDYAPMGGELPPPVIRVEGDVGFSLDTVGQPLEGRQLLNLVLDGVKAEIAIYVNGKVSNLLMCGLELRGFNKGLVMNPIPPTHGVSLRDSYAHDIVGGPVFGTGGGSCRSCSIKGNLFDHVSTTDDAAIVFWGDGNANSDLVISENTFEHIGQQKPEDLCGSAVVVNNADTDVIIDHNTFTQDVVPEGAGGADTVQGAIGNCKAITLSGTDPNTGQAKRARITRNRVSNYGDQHFRISFCDDCVIENNLIYQAQPIHSATIAVGASKGLTVRNNTVFFAESAGSFSNGESSGFLFESDDGITLANNLIVNLSSTQRFSCFFGLHPSPANFVHSDNNGCYYPNIVLGEWVSGIGKLFDWRQATPAGTDLSSFYGNPKLNAQMAPTSGSASPAIGTGDHANAPATDLNGTTRRNPPDIGAYEHP